MLLAEVIATVRAQPPCLTRYPIIHTAGILELAVHRNGRVLGRVLPRRAK